MKEFRTCFVKTLIALSVGVMFFASCKEEETISKSTACDILEFKIGELPWEIGENEVTYTYPSIILPTPLTPTITVSPGATINPTSGVEQNNFFKESGQEYIVTAEDRITVKIYTAKAIRTPYSECEITEFTAGGVAWTIEDTLITHVFPAATKETSLMPMIEISKGARINPPASETQNFFTAQGVKYTVTSEDGKWSKTYTVRAKKIQTGCDITLFNVNGVSWNISDTAITYVYPSGTAEGPLTPIIMLSPSATVNPPSGEAQNFFTAQGVEYTVTAEDPTVTKTYTVKARIASSNCNILSFSTDGTEWNINNDDALITHVFPAETVEGQLTPTIALPERATISPSAGEAQNFFTESGVRYTVTAEDGTEKTYTVRAIKTSPNCNILSFSAGDVEWDINNDNSLITHNFPIGTAETPLTATITLSPGATVNPPSGEAQNFFTAQGVTYTVTAEDGTTRTYTVKASVGVKHDRHDWTVVTRYGYHDWGADGVGNQDLWAGGHPMLMLDDDPASGWHSNVWYVPDDGVLPQVVIIDMKEWIQVSKIVVEGDYIKNVQIYIQQYGVPVSGYFPYQVDWDGWYTQLDYDDYYLNPVKEMIPSGLPIDEWGDLVEQVSADENSDFSVTLQEAMTGQYLILVFPNSNNGHYIAIRNIDVYE